MNSKKEFLIRLPVSLVIATFIVGVSCIIVIVIGLNPSQIIMAQQQSQVNLTSDEKQMTLEGISFEIGNVTFSHHTATVNGIQMHYVIGGKGDPVVLLHGYPQS